MIQELELESSQEKEVVVQFDPTYCRDRVSQAEDNQLVVAYREHPLRVRCYYTDPAYLLCDLLCVCCLLVGVLESQCQGFLSQP